MRRSILCFGLLLAACALPAPVATSTLVSADAATSLAVGESLTRLESSQTASEGMDPVVSLTLRHADGRTMAFQQGNHTAHDLTASAPGGALAQIMGLQGEESTVLWRAVSGESGSNEGAFFCGPQGPALIGTHESADGSVQVVGLRQEIEFETLSDGQTLALPYSPDQVCGRLRFRKG